MYPGTIYNWYDQSEEQQEQALVKIDNSPLFMVVGSFDKGPEDLREVAGEKFNKLYGKMNFEKHGQNAIQAQRIINAGGRILIKRVCAQDSTIANIVLVANVNTSEIQKVNAEGNKVYLDDNGEETTEVTLTPVMVKNTVIKWESFNITNCKSFSEVKEKALKLLDEENGVYPLFVFTDNGRGLSSKSVRLIPDYNTSKGIGKTFYTATVFEGKTVIESVPITVDPAVIYSNQAYGLEENVMEQVKGEVIDVIFEAYINKLANCLDTTEDVIRKEDIVFGYTSKGSTLDGVTIDAESVDLNADYGIELKEGSNGEFGDKPVNTEAWVEEIRKVYAGEVTDEVWDVEQHKIAAVCDANFPLVIKETIAKWVNFRKDCVFFRDLGLDLYTFLQIKSAYEQNETRSKFIADYATSYSVKDPVTKKNIRVTMMYDFVECLVTHLASSTYNPLAGTANGFILKEAIKGTLNYTPIVTPSVNQKQAMDDIRVNYAIFEEDNCVVQSTYTSQEQTTQLSYINNVLAIQEVARAVRTSCPRNRFSVVSGADMSSYAKAVNNVLTGFAGHFAVLKFEYQKNQLKASQKIFYATIKFAFNDWGQTEIFDLFAINND